MKRILSITLALGLALALAGCPKKPTTVPPATTGQAIPQTGATTKGAAGGDGGDAQPLPGSGGSPGQTGPSSVAENTVYFDFDSSEIKPQYHAVIAAQGKRLAANRSLHVRLEGHTDERGSAEYNVALGERRAQAVKRALLLQGVGEGQLATVSFGAERPVADGHDESAWSQNRRVEFVSGANR